MANGRGRSPQNAAQKYSGNSQGVLEAWHKKKKLIDGEQVVKLQPGTPEYADAEKEIERQRKESKNRFNEPEDRGCRNFLGSSLAEKSCIQSDKSIKKDELQASEIPRDNDMLIATEEKNTIEVRTLSDNEKINHDPILFTVISKLDAIKSYIGTDITSDFLWETCVPEFIKEFENWLESKPDLYLIEKISKDFGTAMNCAGESQILDHKKNQEILSKIKQFAASFDYLYNNREYLDKTTREFLEKIGSLPIQVSRYENRDQSMANVKKNIQNSLCEFLNIRNRILKAEELIFAVCRMPKNEQ